MLSLAIDNTNPNSRVSSRANTAGDDQLLPVVAGTHSHSTGATVEAETIISQAVSATHSTWSPWSVCKGSI